MFPRRPNPSPFSGSQYLPLKVTYEIASGETRVEFIGVTNVTTIASIAHNFAPGNRTVLYYERPVDEMDVIALHGRSTVRTAGIIKSRKVKGKRMEYAECFAVVHWTKTESTDPDKNEWSNISASLIGDGVDENWTDRCQLIFQPFLSHATDRLMTLNNRMEMCDVAVNEATNSVPLELILMDRPESQWMSECIHRLAQTRSHYELKAKLWDAINDLYPCIANVAFAMTRERFEAAPTKMVQLAGPRGAEGLGPVVNMVLPRRDGVEMVWGPYSDLWVDVMELCGSFDPSTGLECRCEDDCKCVEGNLQEHIKGLRSRKVVSVDYTALVHPADEPDPEDESEEDESEEDESEEDDEDESESDDDSVVVSTRAFARSSVLRDE